MTDLVLRFAAAAASVDAIVVIVEDVVVPFLPLRRVGVDVGVEEGEDSNTVEDVEEVVDVVVASIVGGAGE